MSETPSAEKDAGALALSAWVDSLWTTPCAHGGGYARDCTRCIHETLYASEWLALERSAARRSTRCPACCGTGISLNLTPCAACVLPPGEGRA